MDEKTRIKLGLLFAAIVVFGVGMATGLDWTRYVAIGLLAAAVLMRFVPRGPRPGGD